MAKQRKIRARVKTGLAAAPVDNFEKLKFYFHYEMDNKPIADLVKGWLKENYSKEDYKAIVANPDYNFYYSLFGAGIYWAKLEKEFPEAYSHFFKVVKDYYDPLIISGNNILKEKALEEKTEASSNVVTLSPQQRLANKINQTIIADLEDLEQSWMNGEKNTIDLYTQFKKHGLTGAAIEPVRKHILVWLEEYTGAYKQTDDQLVEGYSHIPMPELRRRMKVCEDMLADLEKIKNATKAVRKTRVPKAKAADKQVSKLNYCKENNEFKLVSISPLLIVGAMRLYVFNTKSKEIIEYVSNSVNGFAVKGSTLQNVHEDSRKTRLRKPNDFLPHVQSKTSRQIDNEWSKLTTKSNTPNGRINKDCILVRVMAS